MSSETRELAVSGTDYETLRETARLVEQNGAVTTNRQLELARGVLALLGERDTLRDALERLERWAREQNAGNAFAAQLAESIAVTLTEAHLPPEEREP